jgi:hypothetical protein
MWGPIMCSSEEMSIPEHKFNGASSRTRLLFSVVGDNRDFKNQAIASCGLLHLLARLDQMVQINFHPQAGARVRRPEVAFSTREAVGDVRRT